ncbi:hypothetical protein [Bradyrhizobium hipponense]|nr:hypothetical protein [Bradyrhizobium hipponense]
MMLLLIGMPTLIVSGIVTGIIILSTSRGIAMGRRRHCRRSSGC